MRFSILSLLVVTAIVGVFCVAFVQRTLLWLFITGVIAHSLVVLGTIKTWSSSGRDRGVWLGFAVSTFLYLLYSSSTGVFLQFPYYLANWMAGSVSPEIQINVETYPIRGIMQHAFCIGLGAAGACIGYFAGKPAAYSPE